MPVFRGFSEVKGVKIPKIVTYHTTVKTMFMHCFGAIFRRGKTGSEHVPKRSCVECYATGVAAIFRKRIFGERKRGKICRKKEVLNPAETGSEKTFESGGGDLCGAIGFEAEYAPQS